MSNKKFAVAMTSIASPNGVIKAIAGECSNDTDKYFVITGDTKSPDKFEQTGCDFYSISRQLETGFDIAPLLPTKHYSRKNIAYLLAWRKGFEIIVETDDDNYPLTPFWGERELSVTGNTIIETGWINVYKHYSKENIWPRGLPLEQIQKANLFTVSSAKQKLPCPIQQGLANQNPDVDAVYRMIGKLPVDFDEKEPVLLSKNQWCPFNSQNTTWFIDAFPLLYLPSFCSFRMTDIWRSFVAQRVAWENDWSMSFHASTVYQERNEHNLLKDFMDEVPGYENNEKIRVMLEKLSLKKGKEYIYDNLLSCYQLLVEEKIITSEKELELVKAWIADCKKLAK